MTSRSGAHSARCGAASGERGHIVQPEVLFPRQLALDVGGLDVRNHHTMDLRVVGQVPAGRRGVSATRTSPSRCSGMHGEQKTGQGWAHDAVAGRDGGETRDQAQHLPETDARDRRPNCTPTSATTG